jgi:hypothetical protein
MQPLRYIFAPIALTLGVICLCEAQTTTTPSAHFGALMFPRDSIGYEFGIHFNRFTEFDKATVTVDGVEEYIRYNHIDRTYGFNLLAVAVTRPLSRSNDLLYRVTLQAGVTADEPTEHLQNKWIHDLRNIPHVPVEEAPTQFDADVSAEITRWFGSAGRFRTFAGGGLSLGTINQDAFLQTGARSPTWSPGGYPVIALSGVARLGVPAGGRSFRSGEIANSYAIVQGFGTFPVAGHLSCGVLPVVEWGLTYSTGFFVNAAGKRLDELFWTIRLEWSDQFAIETWNDSLNGKDRGPTYGVRITTSFESIPLLDRLL